MSISIVTDSTSDIPTDYARALGIEVVPGYVHFGKDTYRDGIDINLETFYKKLVSSPFHPTTSAPTPDDFEKVYLNCSQKAENIISVHASSKVSDILKSAKEARKRIKGQCRIEIIDSCSISIGLGLIVRNAAQLSKSGESMEEIVEEVNRDLKKIRMLGVLSTMKYLMKGRRVVKITAALSQVYDIKPVMRFDIGEVMQDGIIHGDSPTSIIRRLYEFVQTSANIEDLAVAYSSIPDLANTLMEKLSYIVPAEKINLYHLGAALGVHSGPGALVVALRRGS